MTVPYKMPVRISKDDAGEVPVPLVANYICVFPKHCFSYFYAQFCCFMYPKMMQEKLFIVSLMLCYPFDEVKSSLKIEKKEAAEIL